MRIARLLSLVLAVLAAGTRCSLRPPPPNHRSGCRTTSPTRRACCPPRDAATCRQAVDKLYNDKRIRLWVVYVKDFSGQSWLSWAQSTMQCKRSRRRRCAAGDRHRRPGVRLRRAERGHRWHVDTDRRHPPQRHRTGTAPGRLGRGRRGRGQRAQHAATSDRRRDVVVRPARRACGHRSSPSCCCGCGCGAGGASGGKPSSPPRSGWTRADPNALAAVPIDALDDLSKAIVVDVDNAVRTSDNELALAVEEFGAAQTEPFSRAVTNARTTLAQAFNVRQILDDAVPETPQQRRDLLTRVVVAAAKADRELEAQSEAFEKLRDLVINAPSRLDALTQQMVDLTARIGPSEQALAALHNQFDAAALTSVADNVETAKQRLAFADQNITNARGAGGASGRPADGVGRRGPRRRVFTRAGPLATRRRRQRGDRHQPRGRHAAVGDRRHPERHQPGQRTNCSSPTRRKQPNSPRPATLRRPRSPTPQKSRQQRPAGRLHPADQGRRRPGPAAGQRGRGTRGGRTARPGRSIRRWSPPSRGCKAVSDFIDTRRGSIGPGGADPARRGRASDSRRPRPKRESDTERSHRARQRRGDAGRAGAVAGQRRRSRRAAVLHLADTAAADPTWAPSSAASSSATFCGEAFPADSVAGTEAASAAASAAAAGMRLVALDGAATAAAARRSSANSAKRPKGGRGAFVFP